MAKKDFTKQAEQDIHSMEATYEEAEARKGIRTGTRGLAGARMITIERLKADPSQPRKTFPEESIRELAESIKEYGVLQPLAVLYRDDEDLFQIINGERRYRAALVAGLKEVPCIIKEAPDDERLLQQLIENLQREDLPPLEEAESLKALMDQFGYAQQDIARILGKSKSSISETLSLIRLPEEIKTEVRTSELVPKNLLFQIIREESNDRKRRLWEKIKSDDLTVREARKQVRRTKSGKRSRPFNYRFSPDDGSYTLYIKFKKSQVGREELIGILKELASRLEQEP